jgi:hypothetical protein
MPAVDPSSLVARAPRGTMIMISLALPLVDATVIVEQWSIRGHGPPLLQGSQDNVGMRGAIILCRRSFYTL